MCHPIRVSSIMNFIAHASASTMKTSKRNRLTVESKINRLKCENRSLKLKIKKLKAEKIILFGEKKKLQKLYCAAIHVNKHVKVEELKKRYATVPGGNLVYDNYENIFDKTTLDKLRKLKNGKRSDSTFILICMRSLFTNVQDLRSKTACGRNKNGISPEKYGHIKDIFLERLLHENITDEEFNQRHVRLNALINTAINNIIRSADHKVFGPSLQTTKNLKLMPYNAAPADTHQIDAIKNSTFTNINVLTELNAQEVIMPF